ncbi:MAG: hypothetical protein KJ709_07450 [Nanoarchaeota archaeon]|nr:hypothetical protein [Nanoarchaeota archaeon]
MRAVAIALLTILLFLAGCGDGEVDQGSSGAFIGGTRGLNIEFTEGAPPEEIFDTNDKFDINVMIENVGEWHVVKEFAIITIKGINMDDFGITSLSKTPDEDLEPAQKDPQGHEIKGTKTNVEFSDLEYVGDVAGEVVFDNLVAQACFGYGTKVQSKICVNEDLLGTAGEDRICDPNAQRDVENSGGPVHITEMEESVLGSNKIAFTFTVKHVGGGDIYQNMSGCIGEREYKNKVWVEIHDPDIGALSCSGLEKTGDLVSGEITLYEDEKSQRCTITLAEDDFGDFEKVIEMELSYDYKELVDTKLIVKHGS